MAALPQELTPASMPVPALPAAPAPVVVPDPPPRRSARRARRPGRYIAAMLLLGSITVFGCVALNALAAEESFAARELEQQVNELTRTADELTVDVTKLESPSRLHRRAVRDLGMVRAQRPAFVVLPGDASTDSRPSSRTMAAPRPANGK